MVLNEKLKRELRGRSHSLKPVVSIGNAGLNTAVMREIRLSLEHHELMKIRVSTGNRDERTQIIGEVCAAADAELVQSIGNMALLYRKRSN